MDFLEDHIIWRIKVGIHRILMLFWIFINPRKIWHLPQLIDDINHMYHHELGLAEDHRDGKAGDCPRTEKFHLFCAEEYEEALGPFIIK